MARCANPARVAMAVAVLTALLLAVATGGQASSLRALRAVGSPPSPAFLEETAADSLFLMEHLWGEAKEKGLTKTDAPEYTEALNADYAKAKDDKLAYYTYKILHYIHVAHVGLEYAEMGVHKVQHSKMVMDNLAKAVNAYKTEVDALRAVFKNYAEAFQTVNTYISTRKTMAQMATASFKAKLASKPAAVRAASTKTAIEMNAWLTANLPKVRRSAAYLAQYARAIREIKDAWFAAMAPFFSSLSKIPAGGRVAASTLQRLNTVLSSCRRLAAIKGFEVVTRMAASVANLSKAGGRFAIASLKTIVSPKFIHGVLFVGVAFEVANGVLKSKSSTTAGLILDGVLKGGIGYLIMSNPVVALMDLILPKSLRLSSLLKGVSDILVGSLELIFTGDTVMLDRVHKASLSGEYGLIMNLASAAGEALAGDWSHIQELNERNLSGKNGAIVHMVASYGELFFNGNVQPLANYQKMALEGKHGTIARVLAESGEFWAQHGLGGGLREVYESVVAGSSWFGRPENKAIVVYKMPTAKGMYFKVRKCSRGAVAQADRPMWSCQPKYVFNRRQRRLAGVKHTNVAQKRSDGSYYWDYNADKTKSGFGMFWRSMDFTRTMQCTLGDSVRLWPDTKFSGTSMRVFAPNPNTRNFIEVDVTKNGRKIGTCEVLINFQK